MLFDVGLRSEQSLLFATPTRDADRAARFNTDRFENAGGFHHRRAAHGVVGRTGRRVPRIEVSAKHNDFVFLIRTVNLADRVVARHTVRDSAVADVKFEFDRCFVSQKPGDPTVIFVTHNDGRDHLGDIESAVVECPHQTVIHIRTVNPERDIIVHKKFINLFAKLRPGQSSRSRCWRCAAASARTAWSARSGIGRIKTLFRVLVRSSFWSRVLCLIDKDVFADEDDLAVDARFYAFKVCGQLFLRRILHDRRVSFGWNQRENNIHRL